tara:strand:+ start:64 stop:3057 length:2994 start_codon:yes stop_codon:yes gene_type:complete
MSVKKFKFVSPGVFINEIDNSGVPDIPDAIGPVVIGRAEKGPALLPTTVDSFSEFVEIFGLPAAGGLGGDVWRNGNYTSPMYGTYAAQAWLKNNSPLTYVRLLGDQHPNAGTTKVLGAAGWVAGSGVADTADADNGGAYGLFILPRLSTANHVTGTLAAVFYVNGASIALSGSKAINSALFADFSKGAGSAIRSSGANFEFTLVVDDGTNQEKHKIDFNKDSKYYIRKVLNTNPMKTNSSLASSTKKYWLGETFDRYLTTGDVGGVGATATNNASGPRKHPTFTGVSSAAAGDVFGVVAALQTVNGSKNSSDHLEGMKKSSTNWIFSQNLDGHSSAFTPDPDASTAFTKKLFKLHSHTGGEWNQNNIKISIIDIKPSKNSQTDYGSFTVLIRQMGDSDGSMRILETYSNVNLNPNSLDYISRRIGDIRYVWDNDALRYIEKGNYANRSAYVYVEVHQDVFNTVNDARYLPAGFIGPDRLSPFTFVSGTTRALSGPKTYRTVNRATANNPHITFLTKNDSNAAAIPNLDSLSTAAVAFLKSAFSGSIVFPAVALRSGSSDSALSHGRFACYGFDSTRSGVSNRLEKSNIDLLRRPAPDLATNTSASFFFTLDDLVAMDGQYVYASGSYASSESVTAITGAFDFLVDPRTDASPAYPANRFTVPLVGGFDGLDITESDPFNNTRALATADALNNYAYYSVKKAIDTISDAEQVEVNLATVPGVTKESLTNHLVETCEARGDTLAVIDLKGGYTAIAEDGGTKISNEDYGSVKETVDAMLDRALNSSYGCAFYPWVQIRDAINDQILWVPPSVVALGTFSSSERKSAPWFAPAGFTRGGLTEGAAGVPVLSVREKLSSEDRDKLYENNINPIASFPAEGIVIFGQKTLQLTQSALDRINVRRLLIFVKKEVSRIAATTLFEPNVEQTWGNFTGRVIPFLETVSAGGGLTAFRVVLDESTTTPDLVDRNIMYAKIFLKPAKAIEFIALDFIVTNSGASFED